MRVIGTLKDSIKKNRFVPVIFESNGVFYSQKTKNEFQYFFEKLDVTENEIFKSEESKYYPDDLKQLVYGFCENIDEILFGTNQELFIYLFNKMDEINDSLVKLKISRALNLNGQSRKLEIDRDIFFSKKNIKIDFDDKSNYVTIDKLSDKTEELLNSRLENYSCKIQENNDLKWSQIVLSEPNENNNIYIDKFRFRLTEVFDLLLKHNKNEKLKTTLIDKHNAFVSYNIENNFEHLSVDSDIKHFEIDNAINFIKQKNNG